jgi:hypothetical protein
LPQARHDYARLLLDVIDFANPLPRQSAPQTTAMSAADNLHQRLRTILDAAPRPPRTGPAGVLAACLACLIRPCELQFGRLGGGPDARAAVSAELEPAERASFPPIDDRQLGLATFCCPP